MSQRYNKCFAIHNSIEVELNYEQQNIHLYRCLLNKSACEENKTVCDTSSIQFNRKSIKLFFCIQNTFMYVGMANEHVFSPVKLKRFQLIKINANLSILWQFIQSPNYVHILICCAQNYQIVIKNICIHRILNTYICVLSGLFNNWFAQICKKNMCA